MPLSLPRQVAVLPPSAASMPTPTPAPASEAEALAEQERRRLEEAHAADLSRLLTGAIFASVLSDQQHHHHQPQPRAGVPVRPHSPGPDLLLPLGEHQRAADISGATSNSSGAPHAHASSMHAGGICPGSGRRSCRITAAAAAAAGASPGSARGTRRRLLVDGEEAKGRSAGSPRGSVDPALSRSDLSLAAEADAAAGWPESPGMVTGAAHAAAAAAAATAAAEVERLEGELEETAAECDRSGWVGLGDWKLECAWRCCRFSCRMQCLLTVSPPACPLFLPCRRGEALRECQEMVEELQVGGWAGWGGIECWLAGSGG